MLVAAVFLKLYNWPAVCELQQVKAAGLILQNQEASHLLCCRDRALRRKMNSSRDMHFSYIHTVHTYIQCMHTESIIIIIWNYYIMLLSACLFIHSIYYGGKTPKIKNLECWRNITLIVNNCLLLVNMKFYFEFRCWWEKIFILSLFPHPAWVISHPTSLWSYFCVAIVFFFDFNTALCCETFCLMRLTLFVCS